MEECVRGSTEPSRTIFHTPMAQYQQCHDYEAYDLGAKKNSPKSSDRVIIKFGRLGLRFRVRVNFVVRVSGMSTVRVNVWVRVRVSNLLGSD